MPPLNFQLRQVQIHIRYPESPIFLEETGRVINANISNFDTWLRFTSSFALSIDREPRARLRISDTILTADIDATDQADDKILQSTSTVRDLVLQLLHGYGYHNAQTARFRFRYIADASDQGAALKELIASTPSALPEALSQPLDSSVSYAFAAGDFWWYVGVYFAYPADIKDALPSFLQPGPKTCVVGYVSLESPRSSEVISAEAVDRLLSTDPSAFSQMSSRLFSRFAQQ